MTWKLLWKWRLALRRVYSHFFQWTRGLIKTCPGWLDTCRDLARRDFRLRLTHPISIKGAMVKFQLLKWNDSQLLQTDCVKVEISVGFYSALHDSNMPMLSNVFCCYTSEPDYWLGKRSSIFSDWLCWFFSFAFQFIAFVYFTVTFTKSPYSLSYFFWFFCSVVDLLVFVVTACGFPILWLTL